MGWRHEPRRHRRKATSDERAMTPYPVGQMVEVSLPLALRLVISPPGEPSVERPTEVMTLPGGGADSWHAGVVCGVTPGGLYTVAVADPLTPAARFVRVAGERVRLSSRP